MRRTQTQNKRVFAQKLASLTRLENEFRWYIKVDYEDGFTNEGEYTDKKELMKAYKAFIE